MCVYTTVGLWITGLYLACHKIYRRRYPVLCPLASSARRFHCRFRAANDSRVKQGNRRYQTSPPVRCCPLVVQFQYTPPCQILVAAVESVSVYAYFFVPSGHLPLFSKNTSSIKPEIHNVSQRTQRRTEPPLSVTDVKNLVKIGHVVPEMRSRTNTQKNTQTC